MHTFQNKVHSDDLGYHSQKTTHPLLNMQHSHGLTSSALCTLNKKTTQRKEKNQEFGSWEEEPKDIIQCCLDIFPEHLEPPNAQSSVLSLRDCTCVCSLQAHVHELMKASSKILTLTSTKITWKCWINHVFTEQFREKLFLMAMFHGTVFLHCKKYILKILQT